MIRAYADLKTNGNFEKAKQISGIIPSHLYVKFTIQNDKELGLLKLDSTLNLFSYPMDVSTADNFNATEYRKQQSLLSKEEIYYASVPVGYSLPKVKYEILEELFIPDDYSIKNGRLKTTNNDIGGVNIEDLVEKSLTLTNNISSENKTQGAVMLSSWTPSGRIRAWDRTTQTFVPIEGLKVRAKRWFTTHTGFTDANGYFVCDGSFQRPADYSFDWERYDFAIRDGDLSIAGENANNITGPWNPDYDDYGGFSTFHAMIFRAAFHYYYGNRLGLRRPPENGTFQTQLKYRARPQESHSNVAGEFEPWRSFLGIGSAIQIYDFLRPSAFIYASVIHETAHASHWNMSSGGDFGNSEDFVAESWARGVETQLTRMIYPTYPYYYEIFWRLSYTGVVNDMIDGFKTDFTTYYYEGLPIFSPMFFPDNVEGYTIRQIEDALVGQTTATGWMNNIVNMYNNPTEQDLPALFTNWNTKIPSQQ